MADEIIGKIFSKDEADQNFGPVLSSVKIPSSELKALISSSNKLVMFNVADGKLSILKEGRALLHPPGFSVKAEEKYAVFSKSIVDELINTGKADTIFIEQRQNVISVSSGLRTLEVSDWCPPFCQ